MKTIIVRSITWSCSLAAISSLLVGCNKQNPTSTPSADETQKAAAPAADTMKKAAESTEATASATDAVKQAAESAKATTETVVTDTTQQAEATAAATTSQAQEWIDKAKSLIAESKYSEASSVLQQLAALKLTDEQQKLVDTLKEQIQKALAAKATGEGASTVGNLLKK